VYFVTARSELRFVGVDVARLASAVPVRFCFFAFGDKVGDVAGEVRSMTSRSYRLDGPAS
jgi:hypothetical protein